jgi:hypothetical protein
MFPFARCRGLRKIFSIIDARGESFVGTCGLTVRPLIAWKTAPVNDLDENAR